MECCGGVWKLVLDDAVGFFLKPTLIFVTASTDRVVVAVVVVVVGEIVVVEVSCRFFHLLIHLSSNKNYSQTDRIRSNFPTNKMGTFWCCSNNSDEDCQGI